MARTGGLGPQGKAAVQRAAATQMEIKASRTTTTAGAPTRRANPSVISAPRPHEQEIEQDLDWTPFDSSRVYEAAYAKDSKQLFVRFVRPTPGHDEYVYNGVETNEWRNFRRAASAGRYINRVLNYKDYHRVN